jgi:hypothetical protein
LTANTKDCACGGQKLIRAFMLVTCTAVVHARLRPLLGFGQGHFHVLDDKRAHPPNYWLI